MNDLVRRLAKEEKMNERVVDAIVNYPFKFFREKCESDDERPIMIKYLGKFVQKTGINKKRVAERRIDYILSTGVELAKEQLGLFTYEEVKGVCDKMLENSEYTNISKLYDSVNYRK